MKIKMVENIIEQVRKFVEDECKKPTSKYGYSPYLGHFIPMANYSKQLAEKLKADVEVVEIAAWLHDIGSIMIGRKDHHITGAEIAEKKLKELNYPDKKIEMVKTCILNHRGSINNHKESVEEQVIADADAMSAFDDIEGQFEASLVWEKKNRFEARKMVFKKLENSWNKLSFQESRDIIKPRYEAVIILLK